MSISAAEFLKWCEVFGVVTGAFDPDVGVISATGTANQVLVNGDSGVAHTGSITLSLPQSIGTDSSPTFSGLTAGNINLASNTISSTNTNGNINLAPDGAGGIAMGSSTSIESGSSSLIVGQLARNSSQSVFFLGSYINSAASPFLSFVKSRSATVGAFSSIAPSDVLGGINFAGDDGTQLRVASQISAAVTGAVSTGIVPSALTFSTTNTSGVLTTALTISNSQFATFAAGISAAKDSTISGISIGAGNNSSATNSALGVAANGVMTSGTHNTSIGYSACNLITQGAGNTCLGSYSGSNNIVGSSQITTANNNILLGYSSSTNSSTSGGVIAIGVNALADAATGSTSADNGAGLAIGSPTFRVGFRGNGTIYPGNLWRIKVNGTYYMIPLAADGSTALPIANGGTGITSFGTGVATALGVSTTATGGFATQVNNTSFTPVVSFATPGDLSVSYSNQVGSYSRNGNMVTYNFGIAFTPTYTTSSGILTVSLPFTAAAGANGWYGALGNTGGVNATYPSGRTTVVGSIDPSSNTFYLRASGAAVNSTNLITTNFASGLAYTISGSITYAVA